MRTVTVRTDRTYFLMAMYINFGSNMHRTHRPYTFLVAMFDLTVHIFGSNFDGFGSNFDGFGSNFADFGSNVFQTLGMYGQTCTQHTIQVHTTVQLLRVSTFARAIDESPALQWKPLTMQAASPVCRSSAIH